MERTLPPAIKTPQSLSNKIIHLIEFPSVSKQSYSRTGDGTKTEFFTRKRTSFHPMNNWCCSQAADKRFSQSSKIDSRF